jgi:hypothetical protein
MKTLAVITVLLCSCGAFSCEYDSTTPESGYIKATINGVEVVHTAPDDFGTVHYAFANEFHIAFSSDANQYLRWSISVTGVDLQNATFPVVIQGPMEGDLGDPTFWCNILDSDPAHSPYGKILAGTSSSYWNTTLIITSFDGSTITGTFEGEGTTSDQEPMVFTGGKFLARF